MLTLKELTAITKLSFIVLIILLHFSPKAQLLPFTPNNFPALGESNCNLDDWNALKALYDSTVGDNWTNRAGWSTIIDGRSVPPRFCNLSNLHGVELNNGRVFSIRLVNNQLSGTIPTQIGNLDELWDLDLSNNQLTGNIPASIDNLGFLRELILTGNQLTDNIPASIGNLSTLISLRLNNNKFSGTIPNQITNLNNLMYLELNNNELNGNIPSALGNLTQLIDLRLNENILTGNIPASIVNLNNLTLLYLYNNKLTGSIPSNFGNLQSLKDLFIYDNYLTGDIPSSFNQLTNLENLRLQNNQLSGTLPVFTSNLISLVIYHNYFSCSAIEAVDESNIGSFLHKPQYIQPTNLSSVQKNVVTEAEIGIKDIVLDPSFNNSSGLSYQWVQNNSSILAQNNVVSIQDVQPEDAGRYFIYITDAGCSLDAFMYISDPMYLVVEGFDLHGQPVEYDQIMVEFETPEVTAVNEANILYNNGGWVADYCNCNRELYLWQFPGTDAAVEALIEIDKKTMDIENDSGDVDGGLNNQLRVSQNFSNGSGYRMISDPSNNNDDVRVFIIDTGFDDTNFSGDSFLNSTAPVDQCYGVNQTIGYSYLDTLSISSNYVDEVWHGTFGFDVITDSLDPNQSIEVIPLKVFDNEGNGNLFDLTCAIYHAIDHDANIINISAGYQGEPSDILAKAINIARENDIFICAAAGNDATNIDNIPQYPASFANHYHYIYDAMGENIIDSIRYNNVISVASIDINDNISSFSNSGPNSVTLFAYGEDIAGEGLNTMGQVTASGTSMATFLVTRELALEISENNSRNYHDILNDFDTSSLTDYTESPSIMNKKLNIDLQTANLRLNKSENITKKINSDSNSTNPIQLNSLIVSKGSLHISYNTTEPGYLDMEFADVNGRILHKVIHKSVDAGNQLITLAMAEQVSSIPGIYFILTKYKSINNDVIIDPIKFVVPR